MPVTSNKSFLDWGEVFHDPVLDPYTSGYSALARMDHRKTGNPKHCITATCSICQKKENPRYRSCSSRNKFIDQELEDRPNVATMNSYVGATLFGRGDYERAIGLYKESLLLARDLKDYWGLTWGVERLAEVAEKLGQLDRAARLWGAADSLRDISGVSWHPGFHSHYTDQRFAALKARLGEARWGQLWAEGRKMKFNEIGTYALEV